MLKVLAGNLSAPLNIDGLHLQRYMLRREEIFQALCDHLLLHDKILVPVQDYLAMTGLLSIVGEKNLIALLTEDRIGFVRLRGSLGYVQGNIDGTVAAYGDPTGKRPDSSPAPDSISAAMQLAQKELKNRQHFQNVVFANTTELDMGQISGITQLDTISDFRQTSLWRDEFATSNPALLNLPGLKPLQVRVLGPETNVASNPIDACLALHLMNIEIYLARQYQCESTYTASPIGDLVTLKLSRLGGTQARAAHAWSFLDYSGIPIISNSLMDNEESLSAFIRLTSSRHAQSFRQWFHSHRDLPEKELVKEYINVIKDTPLAQSKGGKALRIATSLGLGAFGLGALADAASSIADNFLIDRIFREASMKFFVDDLRKFSDRLPKK